MDVGEQELNSDSVLVYRLLLASPLILQDTLRY